MSTEARRVVRGLYAVTPDLDDTERLVASVGAALQGGARLVQYRNKIATPGLRLTQARALKALCATHGARLIVNDHVDIAVECEADGVHLGGDDAKACEAREVLGAARLIGVSCYSNIALARAAQDQGADYVAFGSFFPSQVKPGAVRASIELLVQARRELSVPVVAIGGITRQNAPALLSAGADAVAVITDVFGAPDTARAAAEFTALFGDPS
jgi:thiamine-phosphate pyrophosphorylase